MSFNEVPLKDLLDGKGYIRGPFGSALKRAELKDEGIPVYEQQHAIRGVRDFRYYIDEDKYEKLKRFTVEKNDLIISCSGTVGKISVIRQGDPVGIISQALLILRPNAEKVLPEYLYYFFTSKRGFNELINASQGAVQLNIAPRAVVEKIPVPLPSIEEQKHIVSILKGVDDKIELNRQTNQTLEYISQAIFKSWFVDFEPTRAKIAAKQADQDPERAAMAAISGKLVEELDQLGAEQYEQLKTTAALFPDALVDSELGEIPEGWEVSNLKAVTSKIGSGATPRGGKGAYKTEGISQIRSMNVLDREFSLKELAKIDEEQANKLKNVIVEKDDVLINITGASVTRCCIVPPSVLPARVNQHVCIVRAHRDLMNPFYIYQCLTSNESKLMLMSLAQSGATREALTKSHIENFQIVVPCEALLEIYEEQAKGLSDSGFQKSEESNFLTSIRDGLLPKLLSGEATL